MSQRVFLLITPALKISYRNVVSTPSGSVLQEPKKARFGPIGVLATVATGVYAGALISKTVANFLEENELFVPSDDDDDD